MKKMRIGDIRFNLFLVIFIGIFIATHLSWIKNVPIHQDEIDYVGNSFLWKYFEKSDWKRGIWEAEWSIDQPHLYHYLAGWYLEKNMVAVGLISWCFWGTSCSVMCCRSSRLFS